MIISPAKSASEIENFKKEITFYSNKLVTTKENVFILENKVLALYNNFTLEADYLFLNLEYGYGKSKGNVRFINDDVQIYADEIEFDVSSKYINFKKAHININNLISFDAENIFVTESLIKVEGFNYIDKDLPIEYEIFLKNLNIVPFLNGKYFYLQTKDINFGIFDKKDILPVNIPAYEKFLRNPTLSVNYLEQRRMRNFYGVGEVYSRINVDGYKGLSANVTCGYFGNENSTGYFTADYGIFSNLNFSLYQDLTDNNGNFIQFNGAWQENNLYLKNSAFSGSLDFLHDWKYHTLKLNISSIDYQNQFRLNRLPEITLQSTFKEYANTGLQYRYDVKVSRFLVNQTAKDDIDIGRLRLSGDLNSPKINLFDNLYFELLSNVSYYNYFNNNNYQLGLNAQVQMTHKVFENFTYTPRYRQSFVFGESPLSFDKLTNDKYLGLFANYWFNNSFEISAFTEFSIEQKKFSNIDFLIRYITDRYVISFVADALNLGVNTDIQLVNF